MCNLKAKGSNVFNLGVAMAQEVGVSWNWRVVGLSPHFVDISRCVFGHFDHHRLVWWV